MPRCEESDSGRLVELDDRGDGRNRSTRCLDGWRGRFLRFCSGTLELKSDRIETEKDMSPLLDGSCDGEFGSEEETREREPLFERGVETGDRDVDEVFGLGLGSGSGVSSRVGGAIAEEGKGLS